MNRFEMHDVWSVTYESPDDGHRLTAAYFTDQGQARAWSASNLYGKNQSVVAVRLLEDANGNWYQFKLTMVNVDDIPLREQALAKLTKEEKRALGL